MSVELVVIAPALVLLLLLVGAGGRWVESHGAIDGAARDAARAASVARTAGDAVSLAQQSADADLATSGWCDGGTVAVGVTGFPPDGAVVQPGDAVTVTVSCNVNMSPVHPAGLQRRRPRSPGRRSRRWTRSCAGGRIADPARPTSARAAARTPARTRLTAGRSRCSPWSSRSR